MKTANAIKKMEKLGTVTGSFTDGFKVTHRGYILGICLTTAREGNVSDVIIFTHRKGAHADSQTDYFPETWHDSMKQAVEAINGKYA